MNRIALTTLVVRDYDEAIAFYTDKLGFELTEDSPTAPGRRWVVVSPPGDEAGLLLAKAADSSQRDRAGDQTGGRVAFFLHTDDFVGQHHRMTAAGVHFLEEPRAEAYGTVAVFEDLYGNLWDLVGPT